MLHLFDLYNYRKTLCFKGVDKSASTEAKNSIFLFVAHFKTVGKTALFSTELI